MKRFFLFSLGIPLLAALSAQTGASGAEKDPNKVDFNRQIRPILSDNCFTCHGPDDQQRKAKLRLDTKDGAFDPRGGTPVIIPGDSANSKLFQRIGAEKKALRMPPPYATTSLTQAQIDLVKKWIDQGADWQEHWAFKAPVRPDLPKVSNPDWARNEIDRFVLAKLDSEGLKPSPEADRITLLRRLSFDLTGLPPTPEEISAFIADKGKDAYEKQVDRLLHSPRYGERMAMQWLDLARYADTHGYHIDSHREMWHWRDWVIQAFNKNMPYDHFTIEQLAGDLLPNATAEQKLATGFNRNHVINFEGGAIPEEYQTEYVIDRLDATSTVWMGLTVACARCHDHKYDPIKQREFYQFYAFFNSIPEKGLDGQRGNAMPVLQLPSAEQAARENSLKASITRLKAELPEPEVAKAQIAWEKQRIEKLVAAPTEGLLAHYEFEGSLADSSGHYAYGRALRGDPGYSNGEVGRAVDFDGETQVTLGDAVKPAPFQPERDKPFSIAFWADAAGQNKVSLLQKLSDATERRGLEVYVDDFKLVDIQDRRPRLYVRLAHIWPEDAIEVRTRAWIPKAVPNSQITINYDGSGKAAGFGVFFNGKPVALDILKDSLSGSIANTQPLEIGNKEFGLPWKGKLDDLRFYDRQLGPAEIHSLVVEVPLRAGLYTLPEKRSKDLTKRLRDYFLTNEANENYRQAWAELKADNQELKELQKTIPSSMVMAEFSTMPPPETEDGEEAKDAKILKPRETAVLGRGDYRNRGEIVTPGTPAILPPLPKDQPANRLTLAKWLVSANHPLTSRVTVNRFWQSYFGLGLVKTAENFGSQGEPPSHPLLLDWLATEFVRTGWDVRAMQRLIVTSATYRQQSIATKELIERDPENRLLARGPRFRLPAEMVRDNALFISGLLKERVGGPSVYPYQPKGLWEETAFGDGFSAQSYTPSTGDDLFRRSMYTFWKRTSGPPALITFDAPDREKCTARRLVTNTPLQSLVLLNDKTYVEAARALAQRAILQGGKNPQKRLQVAFRLAMGREPSAQESAILKGLLEKETWVYAQKPELADKLIHDGETQPDPKLDHRELAAWTTVTSTILNMDETITKE